MKLSTPRWWYVRDSDHARVTRFLLTPVSWLWAAVTARRIARATPVDVGIAIISVGNLTVGGSGKTPVAREILRLLRTGGIDAQALSRGYGGRLTRPVQVDPTQHTAADVGDEPLMLAQGSPAWIARDRVAGARAAAEAGAQALVLDDAHQNTLLKKTLSLIVVDGETRGGEWPFGDGAVFPSGPMREPLAAGLARADAVIVLLPADLPQVDPELMALFSITRAQAARLREPSDSALNAQAASDRVANDSALNAQAAKLREPNDSAQESPPLPVFVARLVADTPPPPGPQLGFAGIAKPWKVERSLIAAGCDLVDFAPFPDHATYREIDLRFLADRADLLGAGLVTTEKDWVRLPTAWRARIASWPVVARFDDPTGLTTFVGTALDETRKRS